MAAAITNRRQRKTALPDTSISPSPSASVCPICLVHRFRSDGKGVPARGELDRVATPGNRGGRRCRSDGDQEAELW
jgi:hypothetical protein